MIRVAVVDDQALVRGGIQMICEAQEDVEVCGEAADGCGALELARTQRPDVMLMDVRMPGMGGLEATRRILADDGPRVIVLTTFDLDEYVFEALRTGASGFLLKTTPPSELVAAIRKVAAGESCLGPTVTRRLIEQFVTRPGPAERQAILFELSEREVAVLRLLAQGNSNAEIGQALYISQATVKTHVSRVLSKVGARDRLQAVIVAYEAGLLQPGSPGAAAPDERTRNPFY